MPEGFNGHIAGIPTGPTQPVIGDVIEGLKADLVAVYRAVVALDKRVSESTLNMVEIRPQLIAMKVHTESFPNTLRELHRAFTSTQKTVADFETRLCNLEARIKDGRVGS
jgi:predicted  nucleic acid-binding Zn-ribbon protein